MATKKARTDIPEPDAARVLFLSDRTCCVCRVRGKPVQIHHINDDPSDHSEWNLAVLCFDCHRETQIRGGFDRKLGGEQIVLYRDNWIHLVSRARDLAQPATGPRDAVEVEDVELVTALAEIYRESGELHELVLLYDRVGNDELRDKYIDELLGSNPEPWQVFSLRRLQGRLDLVPEEIVERVLADDREADLTALARNQHALGQFGDATTTYLDVVRESLAEDNPFTAAFYLQEMAAVRLSEQLFALALAKAIEENDLWWQIRALEELGWTTEVAATLERHSDEIEASDNLNLKIKLAEAQGDRDGAIELRKQRAREGEMNHAFFLADADSQDSSSPDMGAGAA